MQAYRVYLQTLDNAHLLDELASIKRSKQPEKYQAVEAALREKMQNSEQEENVRAWVAALPGTTIRLHGYLNPVTIRTARINSRKAAAIIQIDDETRTHYIRYRENES